MKAHSHLVIAHSHFVIAHSHLVIAHYHLVIAHSHFVIALYYFVRLILTSLDPVSLSYSPFSLSEIPFSLNFNNPFFPETLDSLIVYSYINTNPLAPPNSPGSLPPSLQRVAQIVGPVASKRLYFFLGSVTNEEDLNYVFGDGKDAVIHFAGLKAVGESKEKPLSYYKVNQGGTVALLEVFLIFLINIFRMETVQIINIVL